MKVTYAELLLNPRWHHKRSLILKRDRFECANCKNQRVIEESTQGTLFKILNPFQTIFAINKAHGLIRNVYRAEFYSTDMVKRIGWISLDNSSIVHWSTELELFYSSLSKGDYELGEPDGERFYISLIKPKDQLQTFFCRELHAHHNYYQETKLPWEYPDNALKTFCWKCHKDFHSEHTVDWLDANGTVKGVLTPCHRCAGAGYFPQYRHVQNGVCFECRGAKYKELVAS